MPEVTWTVLRMLVLLEDASDGAIVGLRVPAGIEASAAVEWELPPSRHNSSDSIHFFFPSPPNVRPAPSKHRIPSSRTEGSASEAGTIRQHRAIRSAGCPNGRPRQELLSSTEADVRQELTLSLSAVNGSRNKPGVL